MCTLISYLYFTICFDYLIKQPTYVVYKQEVKGGCSDSKTFRQDPPQAYNTNDYKIITDTYDRGHLVPNADYGCPTYITGNVVPQLINFNRGKWQVSEKYIRDNYANHIILKGCKYSGRTYKGFSIPEGCYWIVLDPNNNNKLINNGYIDQFDGTTSKELPQWYYDYINTNTDTNTDSDSDDSSNGYMSYLISIVIVFIMVTTIIVIIYLKSNRITTHHDVTTTNNENDNIQVE